MTCNPFSVLVSGDFATITLEGEGASLGNVKYMPDDTAAWGQRKPDAEATPAFEGSGTPDIALVVNHWTDYTVDLRRNLVTQLLDSIERVVAALTHATDVEQAVTDARKALADFVTYQERRIRRKWRGKVKIVPPSTPRCAFLVISEFKPVIDIAPGLAEPDPKRVVWGISEEVVIKGTQEIMNAHKGTSAMPAPDPARDFAVVYGVGELPIEVTTVVAFGVQGFADEVGSIWENVTAGAGLTIDTLVELLEGRLIPNIDKHAVLEKVAEGLKKGLGEVGDALRAILNEWGGGITLERSSVRIVAINDSAVPKLREEHARCAREKAEAEAKQRENEDSPSDDQSPRPRARATLDGLLDRTLGEYALRGKLHALVDGKIALVVDEANDLKKPGM